MRERATLRRRVFLPKDRVAEPARQTAEGSQKLDWRELFYRSSGPHRERGSELSIRPRLPFRRGDRILVRVGLRGGSGPRVRQGEESPPGCAPEQPDARSLVARES